MDLGERTKHGFSSDNDDDDDAPLIFKRIAAPSKHGQLGSASIKASSQKRDAPSGGATSDRSNGQTSKSQKVKVSSIANVSAEKHSKASSNSLASQSKHSSVNNRTVSNDIEMTHLDKSHGQTEDSDGSDDGKPLSARLNPASATTQKCSSVHFKQPLKQTPGNKSENNYANKIVTDNSYGVPHSSREFVTESAAQKVEEDDSEDDKPLSSKFQSKFSACVSTKKLSESGEDKPLDATRALKSPLQASSSFQKMKANDQKDPSDSDDDKPLVSRKKSINGASTKKYESDEEKPLASKHKHNGSSKRDSGTEITSSKLSHKRPLADGNNSTESLKKAKTADASDPVKIKHESVIKEELKADEDDHIPISQRLKKPASSDKQSLAKKVNKVVSSSFKKEQKITKKTMKNTKYSKSMTVPPGSGGGQKWSTLVHSGVIFPPPYKPHGVKMLYNGQPVDLTPEEEEVATMFAVMKETDYASKPKFIENFMNDWRQILGRNHVIKKFELCDFTPIYDWHMKEKEKKKQMTSEEKKAVKEDKLKLEDKYMWAIVDGVKEKVGNFRVEPPGLFRGRGEHPKMGKLKKRILPRDITINIGKDVPIPECPIAGERWKEVRHDNTVTWLAYWNDPINSKEFKYVFLAASSSLKGQSDKEKYEKARLLKNYIQGIRATYTRDFSSKDATKRQISVATYLIDKLALRAGNEKDDDEADTVGCCTLKVENVVLVPPNNLQFDFLGKDSIRYFNTVEVELPVYKAIGDFRTARKSNGEKKRDNDDLFDMLDTSKLNAHLKELMPGLTAKVFRTYNASITLDEMLSKKTTDGTLPEKIAVYQHANKEVAIICNHQRSVSKSHDAQMSKLNEKIDELKAQQEELKIDLSRANKGKSPLKDAEGKIKKNLSSEVMEKKLLQVDAKIEKMELDKKIKEDLKTVALGTSKINYLDPRITVAWCKRKEVPIEKMFNKSLLAKFSWAMDVDPSFRF